MKEKHSMENRQKQHAPMEENFKLQSNKKRQGYW